MMTMTDTVMLAVVLAVLGFATFLLGYWLGRDTRSKREFSRTSPEYKPARARVGSTNDIAGKPE